MQVSGGRSSRVTLILVGLLFCVYPMGPAIQNIGLSLFVLASGILLRRNLHESSSSSLWSKTRWIFLSMLGFLLWNMVATWISPSPHHSETLGYFVGYSPLLIVPWLGGLLPRLQKKQADTLLSLAAVLVAVWALVALSQYLYPWRWLGSKFVPHITSRAQGFYSHPMSLAYASLLLWPLSVRLIFSRPNQWQSWCLGLGTGLLLVLSMSRVAQVLAALFTLWNIFVLLSGRQRILVLGLSILLGIGVALTENPVSVRFRHMLHPTAEELMSDYPDDRVAFWHAHWLMIEERPLVGHGIHLNLEFRKKYYERLGLSNFPKQYQAHNQYLQVLAEGGLISLFLYGSWFFAIFVALRRHVTSRFFRDTAAQSLIIFMVGSLTQNAFDDTCVRMGLVILLTLICLQMPCLPQNHQVSRTD